MIEHQSTNDDQNLYEALSRLGKPFFINNIQYIPIQIFKKGNNVVVCKCLSIDNQEYVVKIVKRGEDDDFDDCPVGDWKFAKISEELHDASLLTFDFVDNFNDMVVTVSKYRGIDLKNYTDMQINKNGRILLCQILQIFIRIVNALCKLEEANIIHRDIKPENIIISLHDTDCKICAIDVVLADFGIAISNDDRFSNQGMDHIDYSNDLNMHESYTLNGSPGFVAPECAKLGESFKSDIWSLARLILFILFPTNENRITHLDQYSSMVREIISNEVETVRKLIELGNLEEDEDGWIFIFKLLVEMLSENPENRPSCQQILKRIFSENGQIEGPIMLSHQFHHLNQALAENRNVQLICASLGVSLELLDKDDREITLQSVKQFGYYLKYAKEDFKNEKEIVLQAVK
ncbi:predicted protein [Naegleria gruberi]|uniref:Predicted protein n=1 Tax=Naegleria gruberi TaxID=5762 RepID=D2VIB8_NAEGR|nr:uncharacterized protein NAEGRDRAFT_68631 [Naegleria gruberi]EFC43569.1 predicted protein [Naegleria gruberi]|eukprot:XP_002676313.1 predicted protein [Naegleria gruberi strain NEG-M]